MKWRIASSAVIWTYGERKAIIENYVSTSSGCVDGDSGRCSLKGRWLECKKVITIQEANRARRRERVKTYCSV